MTLLLARSGGLFRYWNIPAPALFNPQEDYAMSHEQPKPTPADQARESAKTERHPEVPDHAADEANPAIPGGNRPDAAVAEDPAKPGMIDKSKT